ncbi:MAG TPA: class I SAM-dependent methyltransferase [Gemmatimonadaceae bacterium]|nr:class I SAM-dependent methyltransferase [Gemmatimonadaceae bacterium]
MPKVAEANWTVSPFRLGSREDFARLREVFEHAGYTEAQLCERAGVASVFELWPSNTRKSFEAIVDAQSLFVRLFFDGDSVSANALRDLILPAHLEALLALELLHPAPNAAEMVSATISIYPIEDLYVASDRVTRLHTTIRTQAPGDIVFSPILPQTRGFLRLLPRERCESFLEVCGGSAAASLVAARRFAGHATAIDITERSTRFASFNAALNGVTNFTALQGDLYDPVAGQTFDLIVAHPPYIPSLKTDMVFRDGGEDGEQVTRRVIRELPNYLRPGGQFFIDCMMSTRKSVSVEAHVREMLGDAAEEFDVVVAQGATLDPLHFLLDQAKEGRSAFADLEQWRDVFLGREIDSLVLVAVLLQRRSGPRSVITTRRVQSPLTTGGDLQWMMRWQVASSTWTAEDELRLLSMRPRTLPRTELRSRSRLTEGQWSTEECTLVTLSPFAVEATCPSWYATLLQWCDGRMTGREHLQYLRDTHAVPDDAPEETFARMIRQLVDAGLVEIDEFRLPDATAMRETLGVRERARGSAPVERAD